MSALSLAPDRISVGGDQMTIEAASAQTHGALLAVEVRMRPGGGPPVMHRHAASEVYRVLEGEFTFYVEHEGGAVTRTVAGARDVVPIAGGRSHTIRNESSEDAVAFVVHTPGEAMEGFARAAARLGTDGPPSMEAAIELAEQHGITVTGPIPG